MTEETCSRVGMSLICWKRWEHVPLLPRIRRESTRYISLHRVHSRDQPPRQQRFPRSLSEFAIHRSIDDHHGETHGTLFGSMINSLFSSLFLFHLFWIYTIVIGRKNRFLPLNLLLILDNFVGLLRSDRKEKNCLSDLKVTLFLNSYIATKRYIAISRDMFPIFYFLHHLSPDPFLPAMHLRGARENKYRPIRTRDLPLLWKGSS